MSKIRYYDDFLPPALQARQWSRSEPIEAVEGLRVAPGLRDEFDEVETDEALEFVVRVFRGVRDELDAVLRQRGVDREFIDRVTSRCVEFNSAIPFHSAEYKTVVSEPDEQGRIVVGPHPQAPSQSPMVEVPAHLQGEQVTLFGPPDTAKMTINAMNTMHRRLPNEPAIVEQLLAESGEVPRWGADNEDSKTPLPRSLLAANDNLLKCFDRTLRFEDPARGKVYELAAERLAKPIKRIPGLALPDAGHMLNGASLPLHLVDFGLHLFHNWDHPEALAFYVPKLENEQEAAYVKGFISLAESLICERFEGYELGTVKLFVVFESPRSIFRIREMADALYPHFVGGSLGWHDFLGSTARMFRFDPNYRIPVKADPNIVINHIRESHQILVESLAPIGAVKIGGMYGVLYEEGNPDSFEVSMVGFIKDVYTQLKRGLDGFWVAHPSFVRIGLAMVAAWRKRQADPSDSTIAELIHALVPNRTESEPLLAFVDGPDVEGLSRDHPLYTRGVLAADLQMSELIANDDPEEVRYNVFQALQYLADWLSGNGCVALPAITRNNRGQEVFIRVMDDLATTERSRWELWAEVFHGRVQVDDFERIVSEEVAFIREGRQTPTKRVQVPWAGEAARWYPIAVRLLRQLVLSEDPVEFATELLMPFALDFVRESADPWATVVELVPKHYTH